jgi:probable HAF family extracellular repeat protein
MDSLSSQTKHRQYRLIDVGSFGGPTFPQTVPIIQMMNNMGMVTGGSETTIPDPFAPNCFAGPDCVTLQAFLWNGQRLTHLPELRGGVNSFGAEINQLGVVAGASQNGTLDTTTNFPTQRPVIWINGRAIDLGTLGGSQGVATGVNDLNQAIGVSLTTTPDVFANDFSQVYLLAPATTAAHAFVWLNGRIRDLGTLGGPDSVALSINDFGQVAGLSYTGYDVTNFFLNGEKGNPSLAPFLWQQGKMTNLGTLGGDYVEVITLNNRGQVIGNSTLAGNEGFHPFFWSNGHTQDIGTLGGGFAISLWMNDLGDIVGFSTTAAPSGGHGFLWTRGQMKDLGVLNQDPCSVPLGINLRGQIVGASTDCGDGETAVLWENGQPPVDLNTLVPEGSELYLHEADFINERGEITGLGLLPNGEVRAFVLIPEEGIAVDAAARPRSRPASKTNSPKSVQQPPAGWELINKVRSQFQHKKKLNAR